MQTRSKYVLVSVTVCASIVVGVLAYPRLTSEYNAYVGKMEVTNVEWTDKIDVVYDPEVVRWLNFTVFNHGENATPRDPTTVKLEAYDDGSYRPTDQRTMILVHGINNLILRASTKLSKYRLFVNDATIWEGDLS